MMAYHSGFAVRAVESFKLLIILPQLVRNSKKKYEATVQVYIHTLNT